ncbi:LacI family DNA-binding transcriptional regulator [Arthrobacter sp. M4]|uniref:LacI family DNA-binding transcriptional regulator n=1 Tax=Arthrobacter sp. M4 TaxID=218160 RepID=UPI001CDCBD32|nr:LacI family DNA-binding transcriptional regulator [Arthrobacter sp. M4]MCA4131737.1 LacI family transcriptional regulator [Arthrobacter sp. M4]
MSDVARLADVSIATVSFVINETKPVTAATRKRVEDAMRELGYRRNALGRALASKRTRILAMLYPALQRRLHESAVEFFTSAAERARELDYSLVLWPISNDADQVQELIGNGFIDGVLLMEVQRDDARVEELTGSTMPFSLIGRTRDPKGLPYVDVDFESSLVEVIDYLEGLGHRKICLLDNGSAEHALVDYGPLVRTRATFAEEMERRGLDSVHVSCPDTPISGQEAVDELLATAPDTTAVILMNDSASFGFTTGLTKHGITIPRDISVVLFASTPDVAASTDPRLTLWRLPSTVLGRMGVESLVDQLENRAEEMTQSVAACTFEEGYSTGPAPAGNP